MIRPAAFLQEMTTYAVSRHPAPATLRLDGNEGRPPDASLLVRLAARSPEHMRRYPSTRPLEEMLASRFSVSPARVIVTAGADDGLDRACRAMLGAGREIILPVPTFEMIERYARGAGGKVKTVPWPGGPYPVDAVIGAIGEATAVIAIVSPNNPTGAAATAQDIERVARAAPSSLVIFDHAYAEFADEDLTAFALSHPNVVVFRTLSKAWGLAGLRVGYALGPPEVIGWMRRAGQPYAVAASSLALAEMRLEGGRDDVDALVAQVRREREELFRVLAELGHAPLPSQANFVLCAPRDPLWLRDALAGLGVAVRAWPGHPELGRYVRISCPGDARDFEQLLAALRGATAPDAIVVTEALLPERELLQALSGRAPLGVAAHLPRNEVELALQDKGILVRCVVGSEVMEEADVSLPIGEVIRRLGAKRPWAIVKTLDEVGIARSAGALVLVLGAEDEQAEARFLEAGAARVLRRVESFGMLLP